MAFRTVSITDTYGCPFVKRGAGSLDVGRIALISCAALGMLADCGVLRQAQDDTEPIGVPG
jgi:hypothetical protein